MRRKFLTVSWFPVNRLTDELRKLVCISAKQNFTGELCGRFSLGFGHVRKPSKRVHSVSQHLFRSNLATKRTAANC